MAATAAPWSGDASMIDASVIVESSAIRRRGHYGVVALDEENNPTVTKTQRRSPNAMVLQAQPLRDPRVVALQRAERAAQHGAPTTEAHLPHPRALTASRREERRQLERASPLALSATPLLSSSVLNKTSMEL